MPDTDTTQQTDDDFTDEPASKPDAEKKFSQADLDRVVADRIAREKAKYADYGDLKKRAAAAMTDNEKALAEAEQRGRSAALNQAGIRLATAEFKALGAEASLAKSALDGFLEYADLSRFVGDDGEPDVKAIASAIKRLGGSSGSTNYDGGARSTADKGSDMNSQIRRLAGLG